MATKEQIDEAMTDFIKFGIAAAMPTTNIFTRPIVEQVQAGLLANLKLDESVTGQWLVSNKAKFGWLYKDSLGQEVVFDQLPADQRRAIAIPVTEIQVGNWALMLLTSAIAVAERDEVLAINYRIPMQDVLSYIQSKLAEVTAEINKESQT